jgi:Ca-activated chloride channel homolog
MSDEFETLRAALKAAPPAPDPGAKADALRRAMENFDRTQGNAAAARPMSDRPTRAGILTGVRTMLANLTNRPALAMTASVAALCVGVFAVLPELQRPTPAPEPQASAPAVAQTGTTTPTPPAAPAKTVAPTAAEPKAKAESPGDVAANPSEAAPNMATAELEGANANAVAPATPPLAKRAAPVLADRGRAIAGEADAKLDGFADQPTSEPMMESAPAASAPAGTVMGMVARDTVAQAPLANTEAYSSKPANPVKITAEDPVSTFSIDVDTASYSVIRSSLTNGILPPKEAVRIEEMVNYFPYDYAAPAAGSAPFSTAVSLFQTPWNKDTQLLRIGIQGELPALADRPPLDLVFLIDTSGSMQDPDKLPLLKQSFRLMLNQLRPEDRVAIVTYAGSAGMVLAPTGAKDKTAILDALDRLDAGGSTAGAEGLQQAYQVAERMGGDGRVSRILLATDGDFNVGISDPAALTDFIAKKRESGTYLSVLGFGRGNLDDATMQALAQNGNGQAAYIDTLSEAQKVLVDQLSGALFSIANDVKIQVEFNPATVAEYRLIGYETRAPAQLSDPLRYAKPAPGEASGDLGFLKLRYKAPGQDTSKLIETPIASAVGAPDTDARFAAAIAGMGQLLGDPKYLGAWGWDDAIALASAGRGEDAFGYRAEAIRLMRLAQSLSQ